MTGFGKGGKGQILYDRKEITVGALASEGVAAASAYAPTEDFRILKIDFWVHADNMTVEEQGQALILGLADGELSASEIQECLGARPVDSNDNLALEQAHRPVWPICRVRGLAGPLGDQISLNEGFWDKRWTFSDTDGWKWFVYNPHDDAITTGAVVCVFSKVYGVWVK